MFCLDGIGSSIVDSVPDVLSKSQTRSCASYFMNGFREHYSSYALAQDGGYVETIDRSCTQRFYLRHFICSDLPSHLLCVALPHPAIQSSEEE